MPSEFPMNDPQKIWQNQPTEVTKMSAEQLRLRAQNRESKARLEVLFSIIMGSVLCIFFARAFTANHELVPRIGFGLISCWGIYFGYQAYRWMWPRPLKHDAVFSTTLQSYRRDLEKRRDYVQHIWWRTGLPFCFAGGALSVAPMLIKSVGAPRLLLNLLPVFVLFVIWLPLVLLMRRRGQQKLQREIEELRGLEQQNQ